MARKVLAETPLGNEGDSLVRLWLGVIFPTQVFLTVYVHSNDTGRVQDAILSEIFIDSDNWMRIQVHTLKSYNLYISVYSRVYLSMYIFASMSVYPCY